MAQKTKTIVKDEKAHYSSVKGWNLPISRKFAVEIGRYIKHKDVKKAKTLLQKAISLESAIPFSIYNRDLGHKPGIASGRYPVKASKEILKMLESLEANAENKSLDVNNLVITEFMANQGNMMRHSGRKRGQKMKRTHVYIKAEEKESKEVKNKTEKKKEAKK
jgi:large subunit ribosomal protein L22